jgi:hypothetical protein
MQGIKRVYADVLYYGAFFPGLVKTPDMRKQIDGPHVGVGRCTGFEEGVAVSGSAHGILEKISTSVSYSNTEPLTFNWSCGIDGFVGVSSLLVLSRPIKLHLHGQHEPGMYKRPIVCPSFSLHSMDCFRFLDADCVHGVMLL